VRNFRHVVMMILPGCFSHARKLSIESLQPELVLSMPNEDV
jgi:hypothetical protein